MYMKLYATKQHRSYLWYLTSAKAPQLPTQSSIGSEKS